MSHDLTHSLAYAPPAVRAGGVSWFRGTAIAFALLGAVANTGFVYLTVVSLHQAHWAYRDLRRDPRAYMREVAPATIATLRQPVRLWASHAAFMAAAALGLLLAVDLLIAAVRMKRDPAETLRRLERYARWKGPAAAAMAAAFFWSATEQHAFWVAATRHIPVGSGPPVFSTALLLACALLPLWRVRQALAGLPAQVQQYERVFPEA